MNKKIFALIIIFIAVVSLTFVSASENDTALYLDNDISYQSSFDNEVIGEDIADVSSDSITPTKISVVASEEGIIESDSITITVTLTDENNNPIRGTINRYENNVIMSTNLTNIDGQVVYNLKKSSGFYYERFMFLGDYSHAPASSDLLEVIFANDNTLADLAVRIALSDEVLNLTKDFRGYGINNVVRRNVSNYDQILNQYENLNQGLLINKNFEINGNGHVIEAAESEVDRCFFKIVGATVTLNNLTLLNGYSSNYAIPIIHVSNHPTLNLNNVSIINCTSIGHEIIDIPRFHDSGSDYPYLNVKDSFFSGNNARGIFTESLLNSNIDSSIFENNNGIFCVGLFSSVNVRYNIFVNNTNIFRGNFLPVWDKGDVIGNYWGSNDTSYIEDNRPKGRDIDYNFDSHSYLTIAGNSTFSEEDIQDYDIYFSGTYADKLPIYKTTVSYTSDYSYINSTDIGLSSAPITLRVTPITHGLETLVVQPNLYVLNINITSLNNDNKTIDDVNDTTNETDNDTLILENGDGILNETGNDTLMPQRADIGLKETGYPLMILIVVLLSLGVSSRRKKQ